MSKYIFNILVGLDLLLMSICGGKRNETLSAASWSLEQDEKLAGQIFRPIIDFLFAWYQHDHCRTQWEFEEQWNKTFTGQS